MNNIVEVLKIIDQLKPNKSVGHDKIGNFIIKKVSEEIVNPLTCIFNLSLSTGIVPDNFNVANAILIYKKDNVVVFSNDQSITATMFLLTAHFWQNWKRVFLLCYCHEIYRVAGVDLNYNWRPVRKKWVSPLLAFCVSGFEVSKGREIFWSNHGSFGPPSYRGQVMGQVGSKIKIGPLLSSNNVAARSKKIYNLWYFLCLEAKILGQFRSEVKWGQILDKL